MSEIVDLLKRGRERIEKGWHKYFHYLNAQNHQCHNPKDATSFCALGAICADDEYDYDYCILSYDSEQCIEYLTRCLPSHGFVSRYNDLPTTTKEDILALYDRAISLAESEKALK